MEPEEKIVCILFLCILLVVSVKDIKTRKIPNGLCILICLLEVAEVLMGVNDIFTGIKGAVVVGGAAILLAIATKCGIGGGDIKLVSAGGFFLGFESMIVSVLIGMGIAGIVGLIMIMTGKRERKSNLVLGPFLSMGMVIGLLWGEQIFNNL